jgi:hypothetical protein
MRQLWILGAYALLAVGCSSKAGTPPGGGDGGAPADGGARCRSDAECAPRVCDLGSGACAERPPCTTTADCADAGTGVVCNTCNRTCERLDGGTCVTDVQCNILEGYCDPCTSRCKALQPLCGACTEDRQCGIDIGNKCLTFDGGARGCGRDCSVSGCPTGYVCQSEPSGGRQCRPCAGACGAPGSCSSDRDCPFRSFCNVGPGICPSCVQGCVDDLSCPGQTCHDNGRCAPACPGTSCPQGFTCVGGRCTLVGGCTQNADCRDLPNPPNYCDVSQNRCVPGCDEDNDCLRVAQTQGSLCDRMTRQCVPRPCSGTFACGFQELCNLTTGRCFPAGGSYCQACQGDADCACAAGSTCPPGPNHCLEVQDADGGTRGKFCFVGGCNPDGGAETGCPQGYACRQVPKPGGGTYNACHRACWEPVQ